jgi:hypothetical protein
MFSYQPFMKMGVASWLRSPYTRANKKTETLFSMVVKRDLLP